MLRDEMRLRDKGYILFTTLIVLFVLTLLVVGSSKSGIINQKMQNNWEQYNKVFQRATFGLQQLVSSLEGVSMALPDSTISLKTSYTVVVIDACGNQTVDLESIAKNSISTVILNSRDIFARVPVLQNCDNIPVHQVIWWRES